MKSKQILDIMSAQKHCFMRKCNHKCDRCELEREAKDVLLAYNEVLNMITHEKDIKKEFFNSGVEYAKNEFIRLIEREKNNVGELHKSKEVNDLIYTQVLGLQKAIEVAETIKKKP